MHVIQLEGFFSLFYLFSFSMNVFILIYTGLDPLVRSPRHPQSKPDSPLLTDLKTTVR